MGRKNWKARGYDPVTKSRTIERWSKEKICQLMKETRKINEELKDAEKSKKGK